MTIYLIRHAHAGGRTSDRNDKWRPLSEKGHKRASALVEVFAEWPVDAIYSSPATRCVQTVEPLATAADLSITETDALWEDSYVDLVLDLINDSAGQTIAICSHGNLIPEVIERLAQQGVPISGRGCEKGSVWVVHRDGSDFVSAQYLSKKETLL